MTNPRHERRVKRKKVRQQWAEIEATFHPPKDVHKVTRGSRTPSARAKGHRTNALGQGMFK